MDFGLKAVINTEPVVLALRSKMMNPQETDQIEGTEGHRDVQICDAPLIDLQTMTDVRTGLQTHTQHLVNVEAKANLDSLVRLLEIRKKCFVYATRTILTLLRYK